MSNLVIVESPSKARTIGKYLGSDYEVLASYGHIRDLPSKTGSVKPEENFDIIYVIDDKSKIHVNNIVKAFKKAENIFLATDPDREGEAISWHILEAMKEKKALKKNMKIKRIEFNSITKNSVIQAINNPRDLNKNLIDAQQARRALDYLYGFTLSPVLWKKIPGSKSAGRVQSVALRLICERENEIEKFISREYWNVIFDFTTINPPIEKITSTLTHINGIKIDKFEWPDEKSVKSAILDLDKKTYKVSNIQKKQINRNPQPPFITSSLQQEAARKLGYTAKYTMQIAQKLYEGIDINGETIGLITYMRTDSVTITKEAIDECRKYIQNQYGDKYLPKTSRIYKANKSAQEAHEAIRPTYIDISPISIEYQLDKDQFKLYELIWKRTVSSQMENALLDQVTITISDKEEKILLKTTGSTICFDGFYKLYREGIDDGKEEEHKTLPKLSINEELKLENINPIQHFTEPAPRFSEATLVKNLEELGIGRPSTYASIISVLQERKYVKIDKKRFIPEDRGRLVIAFLVNYFKHYIEYDFTADLENQLDNVSNGELFWKDLLKNFWENFENTVTQAKSLDPLKVAEDMNEALKDSFFPIIENDHSRNCPSCQKGTLSIKFSKFGIFAGCSNYPECKFTKNFSDDKENNVISEEKSDICLGTAQNSKTNIYLKKGPYGPYLQLGEDSLGKEKIKRVQIPSFIIISELDLNLANKIISLPRNIGTNPESGEAVSIGVGKFGPYILHNKKYTSAEKNIGFLDMSLKNALELINNKKPSKSKSEPIKKITDNNDIIEIFDGRYGIYIKYNGKNIPIPKNNNLEELDYKFCINIISNYKKKAE